MPPPPVPLTHGDIVLRLLKRRDAREWADLRERNRGWLRPWETGQPPGSVAHPLGFAARVRQDRRQWRRREAFNAVVEVGGAIVGRISISEIVWGSERSGSLGYWIDRAHAGRDLAPRAAALLTRYAFREGLHRVELATRPENAASMRVAQKLGFRDEGVRRRFLYVDGGWRDHRVFAMTAEDKATAEAWRWLDGVG